MGGAALQVQVGGVGAGFQTRLCSKAPDNLWVEIPSHHPFPSHAPSSAFSLHYTLAFGLSHPQTPALTFPSPQSRAGCEQAGESLVLPLSSLCSCSQHRGGPLIHPGTPALLPDLTNHPGWGLQVSHHRDSITRSGGGWGRGTNSFWNVWWNLICRQHLRFGWGGRKGRE